MTDRPDHADHADPTGHDDEVRRLLADARHDEPMPAAVVARLDRVLADLAEEAGASPRSTPGTVTSLAVRRRRVAQLLVAAAAVVVVGIGVGEVLDRAGSDTAPTSTAEQDTFLGSDGGSADTGAEDEAAGEAAPEAAGEPGDTTTRDDVTVWELRSSDFADDALVAARGYSPQVLAGGTLDRRTALVDSCRARAWGQGAFVPVTYDGTPGVLVFRRPLGDTRVADLFLCGSTEPLRSVTLPAP